MVVAQPPGRDSNPRGAACQLRPGETRRGPSPPGHESIQPHAVPPGQPGNTMERATPQPLRPPLHRGRGGAGAGPQREDTTTSRRTTRAASGPEDPSTRQAARHFPFCPCRAARMSRWYSTQRPRGRTGPWGRQQGRAALGNWDRGPQRTDPGRANTRCARPPPGAPEQTPWTPRSARARPPHPAGRRRPARRRRWSAGHDGCGSAGRGPSSPPVHPLPQRRRGAPRVAPGRPGRRLSARRS